MIYLPFVDKGISGRVEQKKHNFSRDSISLWIPHSRPPQPSALLDLDCLLFKDDSAAMITDGCACVRVCACTVTWQCRTLWLVSASDVYLSWHNHNLVKPDGHSSASRLFHISGPRLYVISMFGCWQHLTVQLLLLVLQVLRVALWGCCWPFFKKDLCLLSRL